MNTTPARTLPRDAAHNHKRLLRAAREAYAEPGSDAGIEEIARRADIGTATPYRRFATKHDLIMALAGELRHLRAVRLAARAQVVERISGTT